MNIKWRFLKMSIKRNKSFSLTAVFTAAMLIGSMAIAGGYDKKKSDIVDTAVANGDFSTLAAALQAGDLIGTLKSDGPFTVFAPTDAAFAKLPAGTIDSLLLPENWDQLVEILTYHVVAGEVTAAQVVKITSAEAVNGMELSINVEDGAVFVNNAEVIATDVMASNGVIHVVDTVILPGS